MASPGRLALLASSSCRYPPVSVERRDRGVLPRVLTEGLCIFLDQITCLFPALAVGTAKDLTHLLH